MLGHVEGPAGPHRPVRRAPDPRRGRRPVRRAPGLGLQAQGPLRGRGRGRLRAPIAAPEDLTERDSPADLVDLVLRFRKELDRGRPGRRPRHHRLAPRPPPPDHRVPGDDQPDPDPRRPGHPGAEEATEVLLHPLRGRDAQRDLAVRLHPLPAHRPTAPGADVEIISWLDDCARYALHVTAHPRVTGPIVLATFRETAGPARDPGLHPDRQRHGLHRPAGRRPRRPQRLRSRTPPPERGPEELPTQPPHHLRQGRTLPADPEEVAARPTRPADHDRRAADPARPVRERVQPPPTAPLPAPPGHPGDRSTTPSPRPCPATAPTPTPTTGSGTTGSTRPAPSPCATTADCTTSASAEPTPEPTSSCSSKTSTSASSTPPPANSSANSSSTPAATTSPPERPKDPPADPEITTAGPAIVGPGVADVLRHHTVGLTGFEPATP